MFPFVDWSGIIIIYRILLLYLRLKSEGKTFLEISRDQQLFNFVLWNDLLNWQVDILYLLAEVQIFLLI